MPNKEQGLTVGELTIAISGLIVILLLWTTFDGQKQSENNSLLLKENIEKKA